MIDLGELEARFDDALAATIPNPVALIFSDLPLAYQGKRDLVFAMGLLNEGENECALILGFIRERLASDPHADVSHLEREAWYYLRTSIDPTWQFDDGLPSMPAAIAFLERVLRERTAAARTLPARPDEPEAVAGGAVLLRTLRDESGVTAPVLS